jgi:hypothetical protein
VNVTSGKQRPRWLATAGTYALLFVLGVAESAVGSFQYSRTAGSFPWVAIVCCLLIIVTSLLGAWGTGSTSGAFAVGAGWLLAAFVLSMPVSNGSVIIAASTPGEWFLYGGTLCVIAAVGLSFSRWVRGTRGR